MSQHNSTYSAVCDFNRESIGEYRFPERFKHNSKRYAKKLYWVLILLLLLFPTKSIFSYFLFSTVLILIFSIKIKIKIAKGVAIIITLLLLQFVFTCARYMVLTDIVGWRDWFELYRFVPLIVLFLKADYLKRFTIADLIKGVFIYLLLDGSISLLQFFSRDPLGLIAFLNSFYGTEGYRIFSLDVVHRVPGLADNNGAHAAILFVCMSIMLSGILQSINTKVCYLGFFFSLILILLAQSRTVLVASCAAIIIVGSILTISSNSKVRLRLLRLFSLFLIFVLFIACLYSMGRLQKIEYAFGLTDKVYNEYAVLGRVDKWYGFREKAKEVPQLILLGYGKSYFGKASASIDSDYLYFLLIHGIFIFTIVILIIFGLLIKSIIRSIKSKGVCSMDILFVMVLTGGAIISISITFYLVPQVIFLLGFIVILRRLEKIRLVQQS